MEKRQTNASRSARHVARRKIPVDRRVNYVPYFLRNLKAKFREKPCFQAKKGCDACGLRHFFKIFVDGETDNVVIYSLVVPVLYMFVFRCVGVFVLFHM
jgi:hypothetical protein